MSSSSTEATRSTLLGSTTLTVLSVLGVGVFVYPTVSRLVGGESIGDGVSDLLVGGLAVTLILGLRGIDWAGDTGHLSDTQDRFAFLGLAGVVIGGCTVVLVYFPDTPAAIGLLLPTVPAALLVVRDVLP